MCKQLVNAELHSGSMLLKERSREVRPGIRSKQPASARKLPVQAPISASSKLSERFRCLSVVRRPRPGAKARMPAAPR